MTNDQVLKLFRKSVEKMKAVQQHAEKLKSIKEGAETAILNRPALTTGPQM